MDGKCVMKTVRPQSALKLSPEGKVKRRATAKIDVNEDFALEDSGGGCRSENRLDSVACIMSTYLNEVSD